MNTKISVTDWPHAPIHKLGPAGAYIITCGTYQKVHLLNSPERLDDFQDLLFRLARHFGWELQAWAILINHYHVVAVTKDSTNLPRFLQELHGRSAQKWNEEDGTPGRKVWHNYRDTHLTYPRSYFARLKYVHDNPEKHGVVQNAADYRWCSRSWLDRVASRAFVQSLDRFRVDGVNVPDDF